MNLKTVIKFITLLNERKVESAPFNKGKTKVYAGVPGNLVAFTCKLSFHRGHDGNVAFFSKTQLVQHYIDTLEAKHVGGRIMIIDTIPALKLINKYFPTEFWSNRITFKIKNNEKK